jgi:hypothetical protein
MKTTNAVLASSLIVLGILCATGCAVDAEEPEQGDEQPVLVKVEEAPVAPTNVTCEYCCGKVFWGFCIGGFTSDGAHGSCRGGDWADGSCHDMKENCADGQQFTLMECGGSTM